MSPAQMVSPLLSAVAVEVVARLGDQRGQDFSRQHLANTMWALATLDYNPGRRALDVMAEALASRAAECNPQEMSNTVWAYAKLGAAPLSLAPFSSFFCCCSREFSPGPHCRFGDRWTQ